ncbi:efflux RND transporter periplasmic adaptor subunit [bacterium]|nr:efflux RND transporter periplasmic adaptor subunit [bacterium]
MALLALALAGCERIEAQASGEDKRLHVTVVRPERRDMVRRITLPGDLEGLERVALQARVAGYVRSMKVDVGDLVDREQVLAELEAPEIEARRGQAEAGFHAAEAQARAASAELPRSLALLKEGEVDVERAGAERKLRDLTFERKKALSKDNGVTQQEVDEAEAGAVLARTGEAAAQARLGTAKETVAAARAMIESAHAKSAAAKAAVLELEMLVSFTTIKAPWKGVVVERHADPGAFVSPGSSMSGAPLLTLVRADKLRIWIDVPEPDATFVTVGQDATVTPAFKGAAPFSKARVSRFAGALDPATRTLRTAIDLDNTEPPTIRPGIYVRVRLELEKRQNALVIPAEAISIKKGKAFVWIVESGKARKKKVEASADDGERVEIVSGIAPESLVITEGKSAVSENSEVVAVEKTPETGK